MSVASLNSSSPDLYTILQQLSTQSQAQTTAAPGTPVAPGTTAADDTTDSTTGTKGHHHHGHHGVSGQIESAVTDALQNAPAGSDPNQVVQNAIQASLQQAAEGAQTNGDPTSAAAPTAAQTAAPATASDTAQGTSSFNSLLQSFGVDPKQFAQDFQSAVQNVGENGTVDFSALFRSFPPGSSVNTVG